MTSKRGRQRGEHGSAYDPEVGPDGAAWLALDEAARLALVVDWHRAAGVEVPSLQGHAAAHVAVESQLALGDPANIRETLRRLQESDGLDRHEAVHAVASVFMAIVNDLLAGRLPPDAVNGRYAADLARLSVKS